MKVIITGATGCLGRNLAEGLFADGIEVLATGRSSNVGARLREQGIDFCPADILSLDQLNDAFLPADCVIHCAAKAADWGTRQEFFETNVTGTRNVVEACKKHGIKKLIFVSTPSIYFTGKDRYDISEDEPLPARQLTHYARTKVINEKELLALGKQGYRVIVFRPRAVYGPYDNTIAPRILRLAEKKNIPLINAGRALTDITYAGNFVDAVRKGLVADDSAWNEVYNISNGDPIKIRDWFAQILEVFDRPFRPKNVPEPLAKAVAVLMEAASSLPFGPKKPSLTRFSVGYMARSMTMSIEKAKHKLGYAPSISNRQGFLEYAGWFRSRGAGR